MCGLHGPCRTEAESCCFPAVQSLKLFLSQEITWRGSRSPRDSAREDKFRAVSRVESKPVNMTTSATPAVPKRRLSQFYIEVPPSPVALSEYKPLSSYIINRSQRAHANLKENRLALPHKSDTPPLHMSLKRKSSLNAEVPPVKKIKQQQRKPTYAKDEENLSGTDTDGQPNGYIYCHQCLKKRDIMGTHLVKRSVYIEDRCPSS